MPYANITGWGKYVPEKVLTNADLAQMVDTSDEWIVSRTGIKERHIRAKGENSSDMAVNASRPALALAGLKPTDLDLILVANSSPDYMMPPVASIIQDKLGATCGAMSIVAGCSGWVYALATAQQFIAAGTKKKILVVGVEIISFAIDYTDRTTCVLFGDAAAAVVIEATETPTGVLAYELGSDGAGALELYVPGAGTVHPLDQEVVDKRLAYLRMNGPEVFKFATRTVAASLKRVIDQAGLLPEDIDLFIPHQANLRIIETSARLMRQPLEKFFVNIQKYGNTSAASVPLAMVEAIEEGRLKPGMKVAMIAFGTGLTWASVVLQFGVTPGAVAEDFIQGGRALYNARRAINAVQDVYQSALLNFQMRRAAARAAAKKRARAQLQAAAPADSVKPAATPESTGVANPTP
jgi:3-oxoacyl-[acyl-carrier-protein] synthase-3